MPTYYFDTSALVPLAIEESSTEYCNWLWNDADTLVSSTLAYVELHAALAQATRQRRLTDSGRLQSIDTFEARWEDILRIPPSDDLLRIAAQLSAQHALRGYDAVHCATAVAAASNDFVAVSGDRDLLRAWNSLGIATIDTAG